MINGGILLILLISLVNTAPIYSTSDASLAFQDLNQNVKLVKDSVMKTNLNKTLEMTDKELISRALNAAKIIITDQINEGLITIDNGLKKLNGCIPKIYNFKQKIDTITRLNFDPRLLLPGYLLLMVDPLNFAKGILNNFIQPNKRNPFNVTLFNGLNQYFPITDTAQLMPKLKEILRKNVAYLDSQPITVYIEQAANIEKVLRDLGLSSRVYQDLLIGGQSVQKVQFNEGKIVIVMFQKLFSVAVDLSQNGTKKQVNILDTVFNKLYSYDEFSFSRLNANNQRQPQMVTQTNFGRLLILTVDDIAENQKIVQKLSSCFRNAATGSEACIDASLQQIQTSPTVRYYVAGVDQRSAVQTNTKFPVYKETVNWKKVFSNFDNPKTIDNLRPFSAKITDLLGQKYTQTQNRFFSILTCAKTPDISVTITSIQGTCTVHMKGDKDSDYTKLLFTASKPETFEIGAVTGWQPFDLRISLKGKIQSVNFFGKLFKRNRKPQFKSKLQFIVNFNGDKKSKIIGPYKGEKGSQEYVFRVDPRKAVIK